MAKAGTNDQSADANGLIYMDHAATTATDPAVVDVMAAFFTTYYGNAATLYSLGVKASEALEASRHTVAQALGAEDREIYFTSGGTESDNWALRGVAYANEAKGRHIITTRIEHHAVLESAEVLRKRGFDVTLLPVDSEGLVSPDDVRKAITDKTTLISVMHANNEVGTIEPVEEIGRIARERGVAFHVDAVQTVGKIPVNVNALNCDLLSLSAHKFHGPKGVGACYVRRGTRIERFMAGGGQEFNRRAGTHNIPGIVGLAKALEMAVGDMEHVRPRLVALARRLRDGLEKRIERVRFNGHPERRVPGNVHICVAGIEGEAMLLCLDMNRVCVSSGSACTTGSLEPSHVLLAMGMPAEIAHGSVRFTLGRENTEAEVDYVLDVFPPIVERLRAMSPTGGASL
jgi:cysteine desulfurase